jgi:hypothetical protein
MSASSSSEFAVSGSPTGSFVVGQLKVTRAVHRILSQDLPAIRERGIVVLYPPRRQLR